MKNFILSDFTAAAYSIPDHNCNDFISMALKFLKPTESYVGLNALSKVMMETAQSRVLEQFMIMKYASGEKIHPAGSYISQCTSYIRFIT